MCGDEEIPPSLVVGRSCCRLGVHFNDVVEITESTGAPPVIGVVEDMDDKWGLAILWMDGSRTWYPFVLWKPDDATGFSMKLADPELYVRTSNYELAPPEFGRGWLPRPNGWLPPAVKRGAKKSTPLASSEAAAKTTERSSPPVLPLSETLRQYGRQTVREALARPLSENLRRYGRQTVREALATVSTGRGEALDGPSLVLRSLQHATAR
mmetsp:Transcript_8289/g.19415  ORF Transcript_8289/g.19415 Transcript_8289/m.19415 type:complete len:210 (-) Transcript_8289:38-667(-)